MGTRTIHGTEAKTTDIYVPLTNAKASMFSTFIICFEWWSKVNRKQKSYPNFRPYNVLYSRKIRNIRNYKIMSREAARLPVHGGCRRQRQGHAPAQHPGGTTASTAQQGMRMPEKSGKFFSIYPCQSHCYFASPDRDSRIGEEAVLQCTVTVLEKCSGCSAL